MVLAGRLFVTVVHTSSSAFRKRVPTPVGVTRRKGGGRGDAQFSRRDEGSRFGESAFALLAC